MTETTETATGMTFRDFLTRVIDDGIAAARQSYSEAHARAKLEGSIAGFEVCRGKTAEELRQQLELAARAQNAAFGGDRTNYWYLRCFHLEVEWVCNVVSAALQNQGEPTIVTPTARGYMKAAEILGIKGGMSLQEFLQRKEN